MSTFCSWTSFLPLLFSFFSLQQGQSPERRCPLCQRPTSRSTETASPVRSLLSEATPTSHFTSTSATSHGPSRSRWGFITRLTTLDAFIPNQTVSVYQTTAPRWWSYCNREKKKQKRWSSHLFHAKLGVISSALNCNYTFNERCSACCLGAQMF